MSRYGYSAERGFERFEDTDPSDLIDQAEAAIDPWQITGMRPEEVESRISQYDRLLDFVGAGQGRYGLGWESTFDVEHDSWIFQSREANDSRQFDSDTPHEEILIWIVKRFHEEVPY